VGAAQAVLCVRYSGYDLDCSVILDGLFAEFDGTSVMHLTNAQYILYTLSV
jgi:hypothetical protein